MIEISGVERRLPESGKFAWVYKMMGTGVSGIEACRQIVQTVEGCKVIMLTSYAEDELLFAAIQAGASGYVLKRIGDNELMLAVDHVSRGE